MISFADLSVWIVSLASILCVLLRPRGIAEAWWACGGAMILILTTLISLRQAYGAIFKGLDVYLFLVGMMILSELAREEGVFDWIAEIAARHAAGSPRRLFLLVYLAGTVVTIFLSNDATAVVLTPAVLVIVRRLKVEAKPHLLACALVANAASFVLPISNPANLVIFGRKMPPLVEWLGAFGLPSLASIVITYFALRLVSRGGLEGKIIEQLPRTRLSPNGRLALAGLIMVAAVLTTVSALGGSLGSPTCISAILVTFAVTVRDRGLPLRVVRGVSWSVIPLVAGLFVLVEALQGAGMLRFAEMSLDAAARFGHVMGNLVTAFSVALLSNGMNNLPVGLISGAAVQSSPAHAAFSHAVLVGVDLGPNLSVTGSLATILWLIALRREKVEITGWQFFKAGLVVMPLALIGSVILLRK